MPVSPEPHGACSVLLAKCQHYAWNRKCCHICPSQKPCERHAVPMLQEVVRPRWVRNRPEALSCQAVGLPSLTAQSLLLCQPGLGSPATKPAGRAVEGTAAASQPRRAQDCHPRPAHSGSRLLTPFPSGTPRRLPPTPLSSGLLPPPWQTSLTSHPLHPILSPPGPTQFGRQPGGGGQRGRGPSGHRMCLWAKCMFSGCPVSSPRCLIWSGQELGWEGQLPTGGQRAHSRH